MPRPPFALLGLPSVQSILEGIVEGLFQDLARALVPDFLKKASVASLRWLVAVPDPTAWPHVSQLEGDMAAVAVSLLAVSFTAAVVRYLAVGVAGGDSPLQPLSSTVSSAALLVAYRWMAHEAVAGVNAFTATILAFPVVGSGLQRTVGVLFGGALLVGSGSLFFALLVIVAVVFAAVMFAVKVLLLIGVGLLYVTGMLAIAARPLGGGGSLARLWLSVATTLALVPVGWTILFALAGALSLDATSFGAAGAGGALPGHVAAALAAVLTFYLAVKLPVAALSHLRASIVGMAGGARAGGGSVGVSGSRGVGRVADAHARLRAGGLQAARSMGSAAGALGAPAGGAVGMAARTAGRLAGPVGFGVAAAGSALAGRGGSEGGGSTGSSGGAERMATGGGEASEKRGGGGLGAEAGGGLKGRVARAGRELAEGPARVRDAARGSGSAGAGGGRAGGGRTGAAGGGPARRDAAAARLGDGGGQPQRRPRRAARAGEGLAPATGRSRHGGSAEVTRGGRAGQADGGRRRPDLSSGPATARPGAGGEAASADAKARRESTRGLVRRPRAPKAAPARVRRGPARPRAGGRESRARARPRPLRRRWWRFGRSSGSGSG